MVHRGAKDAWPTLTPRCCQLDGLVPAGHGFFRNMLFDQLYASIPKDPNIKVQIYNAEIVPGGYTNWHCHNGATFFIALQGEFEAHFEEGILVKAKAGDVYSEPIAKFHRAALVIGSKINKRTKIRIATRNKDKHDHASSRPDADP